MKQILQDINTIQDKDKLITAYLSFRGLQKQHIDSFNYFVEHKIEQIVFSELNRKILCESDPSFLLEYTNIRIDQPTHTQSCDQTTRRSLLYPHECRISDLTYAGDIYVNARIYMKDNEPQEINDIKIGRLPIMLGSNKCNIKDKSEQEIFKFGECQYDPKGYFIINGVEKVILIQEQLVDNRIIVDYNSKTDSLETQVQSYHLETKSKASIIMKKNKFYVKSSSFQDVPLFIFFKALGIQNDKEIIQLIGNEPEVYEKLLLNFEDLEKENVYDQLDALKYIGKSIKNKYGAPTQDQSAIDQAREKLAQVFLAHVNCKRYDFYPRAVYLGLMVRRLILAMDDKKFIDDRDYYGNKRMKCAGQMIELVFEDKFKQFNTAISSYLQKELGKSNKKLLTSKDIGLIMQQNKDILTEGINNCIATGKWQIKRFNMDREGVSQLLARISYTAAMGMMTKMSSQLQKTRKVSGPRALLGSHFGLICPADTPDGESCGLVKTLALLTHITNEINDNKVLNLVISLGVQDLCHFNPTNIHRYLVFLNGNIIGLHQNPKQLAQDIRILRRNGKINEFVSVYVDDIRKLVSISSDSGRLVRPLILVKNGIPQLTQSDVEILKTNVDAQIIFLKYVRQGKLEYLDVNEADNALIALTPQYLQQETTHMEIDQMTILSCVTGLVPFPHHNQSVRNTFQCQMGKQSLGIMGLNQLIRCDTNLYLLIYPQTPLVRTVSMEAINQTNLPAGHNAQVAVMSYSCYDIEDALILNKSSLDRGFGRTAVYKTSVTECLHHTRDGQYRDRIIEPPKYQQGKNQKTFVPKKYHALDNDGITKVGAQLKNGDIYVYKITPQVPNQGSSYREQMMAQVQPAQVEWHDSPSVFKSHWSYNVDRVILTNEQDVKKVKTILRQVRRPELGDKFSSRHGQKGVVGLIVNQEDMPFNENGWCPDLIMNPHGYPSRMTVGKLIELLCGKLGAIQGKFKYGTAFAGENVTDVGAQLLQNGFNFQGKDCLISGITGEYMECYVYQGPIFYQRLKHMVVDKIHARGRGPYQTLTRQPVEGRAKDGGQRLGEMERDCLLAYGASNLLLERLFLSSDPFQVYVCQQCGTFKSTNFCSSCDTDQIYQIRLPYACKLMLQELMSLNIRPKLTLVPVHERQEYTMN